MFIYMPVANFIKLGATAWFASGEFLRGLGFAIYNWKSQFWTDFYTSPFVFLFHNRFLEQPLWVLFHNVCGLSYNLARSLYEHQPFVEKKPYKGDDLVEEDPEE